MTLRSRAWKLGQQRVRVLQMVDLVEHDEVRSADAIELSIQLVERVPGLEPRP